MNNKTKNISTIIFFGAIWGIVEATLGYVLHIIPGLSLYLSGSVLFAFASYILYRAYQKTKSKMSLVYIGGVAALIKATNFFLPVTNIFKVINPIGSIILESLVVLAVIMLISHEDVWSKASGLLIASLAWRLVFFLYKGTSYLPTTFDFVEFFAIYAVASVILGLGLIYLDKVIRNKVTFKFNVFHPAISVTALALAITLTLVL